MAAHNSYAEEQLEVDNARKEVKERRQQLKKHVDEAPASADALTETEQKRYEFSYNRLIALRDEAIKRLETTRELVEDAKKQRPAVANRTDEQAWAHLK